MIKVRYRGSNELSPGLHAAAERHRRGTTVYLLSGLTVQERRSALRRLRLSARMGHCPRLPAGQLALALLADRIRTTVGRAGAVFRLHPAGSTVPVMVLSGGAIAFLLFSTVSIHVLHSPRTADQSSASGTSPVASASAVPVPGGNQGQAAGLSGPGQGGDSGQGQSARGGSSIANSPSLTRAGGAQGTGGNQGANGTSSSGGTTAAGTTLSGGADPPATGGAAPSASSAAGTGSTSGAGATSGATGTSAGATSAATASTAKAAPSPSPSSSGVCVNVGPLGVCLKL